MKEPAVAAIATIFGVCGASAMATTTTSSPAVLSRLQLNATQTTVALTAVGGWGVNTSASSCATVAIAGFDVTTAAGKAMYALATLAIAQQKSVAVYTDNSVCANVGGLAPSVTRLDILN